jgi:hypothetical protein
MPCGYVWIAGTIQSRYRSTRGEQLTFLGGRIIRSNYYAIPWWAVLGFGLGRFRGRVRELATYSGWENVISVPETLRQS